MSDAQACRIETKDAILDAAMMHTAFDGWSRKALLAAADETGVDHPTARRLFPQDGQSLIEWLDDWLDRKMDEAVADIDIASLPVRQRIATLVWARFEALGTHQEALRRAALTRGLPHNWMRSGKGVWKTADRIWECAGFANQPTEGISRYTRRALLVGILASTFLFWLEDMSENAEDSRAFMERRIENALTIGKFAQGFKRFAPSTGFRRAPA